MTMHLNRLLLLALFLLVLNLTPVLSQTVYTQPMYTVNWTSLTITIGVPATPTWAYKDFQTAIQDWNQAQEWFLNTYEPTHTTDKYTLQETTGTGQVTVTYVTTYLGYPWAVGLTSNYGRSISIILSQIGERNYLEVLAEHELAHVMGLYDNCLNSDLLYGLCNGNMPRYASAAGYPSTLDLYAVYIQAHTGNSLEYGDTVTLPPQIEYIQWNPSLLPTPEVQIPTVLAVSVMTLAVLVMRFQRRFLNHK